MSTEPPSCRECGTVCPVCSQRPTGWDSLPGRPPLGTEDEVLEALRYLRPAPDDGRHARRLRPPEWANGAGDLRKSQPTDPSRRSRRTSPLPRLQRRADE